MRRFLQVASVAVALAFAPGGARALSFDEALACAATRADVVAPGEAHAVRAPIDRDLPGRAGNPELQVGLGPGSVQPGFREVGTEFQATLLQPLALTDLGGTRRRSAEAERGFLRAEARRRALEQRRHIARAWLALWSAQRTLAVVTEESAAATTLAEELARGVRAGAVVTGDALEAALAAEESRTRVLAAEGARYETAAALADATALPPLPAPTAEGEAPRVAIPEEAAWPRWIAAAGALPEVDAADWLARARALLVDESAAQGGAWLTVGAQALRNSADQWQLYAMLGFRPALADRNERVRAQALAEAALARGEHLAARRRAPVALALALHEVEHTRATEARLREGSVPAAERLAASREEALRRGAGTVFEVLRARASRWRARAELIVAEGDRHRAELDAWLLLGALPRLPEAP